MARVKIFEFLCNELLRERCFVSSVNMKMVPDMEQFVQRDCLNKLFLFFVADIFCQLLDDFLACVERVLAVVCLHCEARRFVNVFIEIHKIQHFREPFF